MVCAVIGFHQGDTVFCSITNSSVVPDAYWASVVQKHTHTQNLMLSLILSADIQFGFDAQVLKKQKQKITHLAEDQPINCHTANFLPRVMNQSVTTGKN